MLPRFFDLRFLLALPFAVLADLLGFVDTKLADSINRPGVDDS